jgi:putative membrane protein
LDDHTLSNAEVEALARLKGVALPDPTKTDTSTEKLSRLTGIEFDQEFEREAIEDHLRSLAEFEKEDQSATSDSDVKGFAHSALPKMRTHLEQAKALQL